MSHSPSQQLEQSQVQGAVSQGLQRFLTNAQWLCRSSPANKKKSPNYPCKRWGHSAIVHDKYMYIFGGWGKSENFQVKQWEQVFRLDCMQFTWERVISNSAVHPMGRDSHTCAKLRNKLYIFAGSQDKLIFNELWGFELETGEWSQVEVPPEIQPREGHIGIALNERLMYIMGGWNSKITELYSDHWLYDEDTHLFLKIDRLEGTEISKRESHSAVLLGEQVYLFGGQGPNQGKNCVFLKDLYQISFPPLSHLHEIFETVARNICVEDYVKPEISIHVERINTNSIHRPSARASHTAVGYLDRFMFIVGGEGYKSDHQKDTDYENIIEEPDTDDEDKQPCYTKNDVWIFESVLRTWTKLLIRQKSPQFQARCSHSAVVFKDQIIVFGGLKANKDVLDDQMILHLKDTENHLQAFKKEEMKNICKYCQMIYAYTALPKDEEEALYTRVSLEQTHPQNKLTISFVQSLVTLIEWPLQCFGMFVENALVIQEAKSIRISLLEKTRQQLVDQRDEEQIEDDMPPYQFQPISVIEIEEEDPVALTYEEFVFILHNFDQGVLRMGNTQKERDTISKNGVAAQEALNFDKFIHHIQQYANNLKLAALRIGHSFLIVHKQEDEQFVGLVSTNLNINPNVEDLIVFHYRLTEKDGSYQCNDEWHRNLVLSSIQQIYSETELTNQSQLHHTRIVIFDLKKIKLGNDFYLPELSTVGNDIVSVHHRSAGGKELTTLVDYSLRQYLQVYFLEQDTSQKLFVNDAEIVSGLLPLLTEDTVERLEFNNPKSNLRDIHEQFGLYKPKDPQLNYGMLVYSDGRIVQRVPKRFGEQTTATPKHLISGYIQVKEFLEPNIFRNGFENNYDQKILFNSLKQVLKQTYLKRKIETPAAEEPHMKKEVKVDVNEKVEEPKKVETPNKVETPDEVEIPDKMETPEKDKSEQISEQKPIIEEEKAIEIDEQVAPQDDLVVEQEQT